MRLAGDRRAEIVGGAADRLAGRRVADFLEIFEVAMGMAGFAFRGRAEYRRHVVVALDVGLLREIQIAAIGLAFAGERCLQIVLGFRAFKRCHPSLHFFGTGGRSLSRASPMPTSY